MSFKFIVRSFFVYLFVYQEIPFRRGFKAPDLYREYSPDDCFRFKQQKYLQCENVQCRYVVFDTYCNVLANHLKIRALFLITVNETKDNERRIRKSFCSWLTRTLKEIAKLFVKGKSWRCRRSFHFTHLQASFHFVNNFSFKVSFIWKARFHTRKSSLLCSEWWTRKWNRDACIRVAQGIKQYRFRYNL